MAFAPLIKIGVILAVLVALVWAIHSNGRRVERGECRDRENKELVAKNGELANAMGELEKATKENAVLAATNSRLISEVTSNAEKSLTAAVAADAAIRRDPIGLRIPAETCSATGNGAVSSAGDSAEVDHGERRAGGVRLPEGIETDLYNLTFKANRTRIKRDECREFALGLEQMRDEWERGQAAAGAANIE